MNDSFRPGLSTCIEIAGALWSKRFTVPFDVTLEVLISYDSSIPTVNTRSTTTVEWDAANKIYELSAAHEIRTGVDPNGATADIQMDFGKFLNDGTYWFDPDPAERTAAIPSGKIDVLSTCGHELDTPLDSQKLGTPRPESFQGYSFLFDEHSTAIGSYYYFTGG